MKKKQAILIDIDGTICDSRFPVSYLNGERDTNNYNVFFRTLDIVTPIEDVIFDIKAHIEYEKTTLVFLTGRSAVEPSITASLHFINEIFREEIDQEKCYVDYYFRPVNLHNSSLEYKTEKFEMLKSLYNFTHIYEDEIENVKMFEENKQKDCIVHWIKSDYTYSLNSESQENNYVHIPSSIMIHSV